jgi:glyoxylase-like metal-dependent hydrolase (beta-lactamase superfamily II)
MPITRRSVLAAAPAATLGGSALAQTQPPAQPQAQAGAAQPAFYRYRIGDVEVTAIHDGIARRPLEGLVRNAPLDEVKKAMEERFLPTDALPITFTPLVLRTGGRTVVVDTGNGDSGAPTSGRFIPGLRAAGIDPKDVNTVVISHFHGDHINGLRLKDGTWVYPNAEILVPAPEWAFWMSDDRMNQAPEGMKGAFQNVRRVFGPVAKDVKQYEAGKEVAPGVAALALYGHTPGHMGFTVGSGRESMIVVSDTTNHPALFVRNPDWAAVFDMDPDQARQTRRRLFDQAAADRTRLAFFHAPFPASGHVVKDGNGYAFVPIQWGVG